MDIFDSTKFQGSNVSMDILDRTKFLLITSFCSFVVFMCACLSVSFSIPGCIVSVSLMFVVQNCILITPYC